MSTDKKAAYMAKFRKASPQKQRTHIVVALGWLVRLLKAMPPHTSRQRVSLPSLANSDFHDVGRNGPLATC